MINQNPAAISDAQVMAGINDLNDAFGKTGAYSASAGADTKIRFCLAQKDPDGGNTTGITRTTSFFSDHLNKDIEDSRLKNLIQWDPLRYINIWLISSIDAEAYADFICGNWYRLGVGGYATMPPGGGSLDGIVVTGFGSLLAHEMGHYLGLYHTFEGGCFNGDCTLNGDRVCDTPPDNSVRPSSCTNPENSCNTDTLSAYSNGFFHTDVRDQLSNFMDYGNGGCSNQFTQGQADRMRAAIMTQRSGLLQDECTKPCIENIVAGFTRNNPYPIPADNISFTNTSAGATNYKWLVNDVEVATTTDFNYAFTTVGKYKVTLKAFNADANCFAAYTDFVILNCGVTARFYTNKQRIASKLNIYTDSIKFTNTSYNGTSFQWLMSNNQGMPEQVVSTSSTDFTYVFPTPATYRIRLVATNGTCSDTTDAYTVPVAEPTADAVPFNISVSCFQANKVRISFCIVDYGYAPLPANTPVNFYNGDPRLPGAVKLSPTYLLPTVVPGGNCSVCFSHVLNVAYHGLDRLYMVFNDQGNSIPIALPNTSLVELNYANNIQAAPQTKTTITTSICDGQNYFGHTTSGTYIDTIPSVVTGCDSIRTLNLTVNPVYHTTVTTSICEGQNYAGHTTPGMFIDVYRSIRGCDSTRTLFLTVKSVPKTHYIDTICEGENNAGYTTTGKYVDTFSAANGCDSIRTLDLTVNPRKYTPFTIEICEGHSYFAEGKPQTTTGIYRDTLVSHQGCDSILVINLIVHPLPKPNLGIDRGVCIGEMLTLDPGNFHTYLWQDGSTSPTFITNLIGNYSVTVTTIFGCEASDAMRLTEIYPLPVNFLPLDTILCKGNIVRIKSTGFINYNWSTGSTQPYIDVTQNDTYKLIATDRNNCIGADSMKVTFMEDCLILQVPDAFTPNADAINDVFKPLIPALVTKYTMQVFNRWGQLLFETHNSATGWNGRFQGREQPSGAYVYNIRFIDYLGRSVKKSGTVMLIK
ncbi:MAG: M43 family zinc metalloprotease [Chitinophagaceae bacterium]